MDNFILAIVTSYLFAIYLIVLRDKISQKSLRLFKFLLLILFVLDIFVFISEMGQNHTLITQIIVLIPVIYMVLENYSNEIHVILKRLGFFGKKSLRDKIDNDLADKLIDTVDFLANRKIGALITIERNIDLSAFISKALKINAPVTPELLASIFIPTTPLHDGAVIIRGSNILCAKAYYPSTERTDLPLQFGTRHRAAIGISEQSDALTIVVSEETGHVSLTINRQIDYNVSKETMSLYFEKYLKLK